MEVVPEGVNNCLMNFDLVPLVLSVYPRTDV